jgi:protein-tyrosine phosphatase
VNAGSILVICTGNICRSPYIEDRLRHALKDSGIEVTSAGTRALVDHPMDSGSRALLVPLGMDGEGFRARQLTKHLVEEADLILAAAREHRSAAARTHPSALRKAITLRDLADLLEGTSSAAIRARGESGPWVTQVLKAALARRAIVPARQEKVDIVDPVGQPQSVFRQMAAEVDDALRIVIPVLRDVPPTP